MNQVMNVHRLKEILGLRHFFARPQIPSASTLLLSMTQTIPRQHTGKEIVGNTKLQVKIEGLILSSLLAAYVHLFLLNLLQAVLFDHQMHHPPTPDTRPLIPILFSPLNDLPNLRIGLIHRILGSELAAVGFR